MNHRRIALVLASAIFLVLSTAAPAVPALGALGVVTLSNPTGQPGGATGISGVGFTPGSIYTVYFGTVSVLSGTITPGGAINSISFAIPPYPRGTYNVSATTSAGDTSNTVPFTITPAITGSSTSGFVGDTLSISGSGFSANTTVNIYFDGVNVGSTSASTSGSFSGISISAPQTFKGSHSIYGSDSFGPSPIFSYTVSPKLNVTPGSGPVGTPVVVTGTGFGASSAVSLYLDDILVSIPATSTSGQGSFTLSSFNIPATSFGVHTLKAQDASGNSATATFNASQTMAISPQTGNSGTTVTVTGSGFGAGKNIAITYDGGNVVTNPPTATADVNGNFSVSMTVPPSGGGTHSIVASDGSISSTANFTIVAKADISASKGIVGSTVNLSGAGFFAGGKVIIRWDNTETAQTTADPTGAFATSLKVPPSRAGEHNITVSDGVTSKTFTFTISAAVSLKEPTGYVGGDVNVTGSGFAAGAVFTITYDGNRVASAAADGNGSFSDVFKAPVSKGGSHVISATDGVSTVNTTFLMDSTPPQAPSLLQPPDKTSADPQASFAWKPVNDLSGVTYTFQLSTDPNFDTVLIEKTGLTNPGLKLSENERLPSRSAQQPYYWRVKVIDLASNESNWSTSYQFNVGFILPAWGLYVIFGVVCVLIGLGAFWFGRRTSYRWDW